ncbi:FAD-dependent monooxygenase [Plantactinospora sonchi]|uniref:FAD-dependent monooxygenase n=1 Tax=Plantactinospora sonchi TaxID=1544735 RepID=A0ABU7S0U1_9ACTN
MGDSHTTPVIIVGCGPTGATAALELAHHAIPSIVLDSGAVRPQGSRAIAIHRTSLAVWEKLGCVEPMLARGVAWRTRKTYFRQYEMQAQTAPEPAPGELPPFLNLSQHETERHLHAAVVRSPLVDLRWRHTVVGLRQDADGVTVTAQTPSGPVTIRGRYLLACDGARSATRKLLGLDFPGRTYPDRFLIADIRAKLPFPAEPRFFFDHPANPGRNILVHPQPDDIWRIDWQLGGDVVVAQERSSAAMDARIRALIGDLPYELVWLTDYRFHQRLLHRLRHDRVFLLGDAAHLVAPFGARGMNGAIHDVENLCWKLAYVLTGRAGADLLETYQTERWAAQRHNQKVTEATMRFMAPRTRWQRLRRDTILRLRLRRLVDSGRMSTPYTYTSSPLVLPDREPGWAGAPELGAKIVPADPDVRRRLGHGFTALYFTPDPFDAPGVVTMPPDAVSPAGSCLLIRPDGHVAARRRHLAPTELPALVRAVLGEPGAHALAEHGHVGGDVDHDKSLLEPLGGGLR